MSIGQENPDIYLPLQHGESPIIVPPGPAPRAHELLQLRAQPLADEPLAVPIPQPDESDVMEATITGVEEVTSTLTLDESAVDPADVEMPLAGSSSSNLEPSST